MPHLILEDYEQGKISVQSFSDVLRFNLLKNHGGMWIDATIFFFEKFDLIRKLDSSQSFNSLEFSSSKEFLQYKGFTCSWSSFFITSQKNGLFVRTMDSIFREYYRKFRSYTLYFFMDAAYMVCKINGIDCDVLTKIQKCDGDMFLLSKVGNQEFEPSCTPEIFRIPQKLTWSIKITSTNMANTFYNVLLNRQ